jgi:hypothetical protein
MRSGLAPASETPRIKVCAPGLSQPLIEGFQDPLLTLKSLAQRPLKL